MTPRPATAALPALALLGAGLWLVTAPCSCSEYDASLLHYASAADAGADASLLPEASEDVLAEPEPSVDSEPSPEAAPEAQAEADIPDAFDPYWCDSCKDRTLSRPVCSPDTGDQPGADKLVFAFHSLRLGMDATKPTDWRTIGLDLDCMNTSAQGEPVSCKRTAGAAIKVTEDGQQGRDNSFGRNIGSLVIQLETWGLIENLEINQNQALLEGRSGLIAVVEGLGPGRDDSTAKLSMYLARGTFDETGTQELPAQWDGNDRWGPGSESIGVNNEPLFATDAAWMTDGVLVAHMPDGLPIEFHGKKGSLVLSLNGAVVMFRISDDRQQLTEGVIAGAWGLQSALSSIQGFAEQNGICPGDPQYDLAQQAVARAPDIRLDLKPRPDLDCNAISIAMAFTAQKAQMGKPVDPPTPQLGECGDAGADAD